MVNKIFGSRTLLPRIFIIGFMLLFASAGAKVLTTSNADTLTPTNQIQSQPNCINAPAGYANCFSLFRTDPTALSARPQKIARASINGPADVHSCASGSSVGDCGAYDPAQIQAAYNLTSLAASSGKGAVVAIVDASDDPTAESDLAAYRSSYGLPACTTATGCFHKVNEQGIPGSYPQPDAGWTGEISIDLDMVSAICPNCQILLVEANTNSWADLGASVNTASQYGAVAISNSYGGAEGTPTSPNFTPTEKAAFNHPGVGVIAASGDSGYGIASRGEASGAGSSFPAVLPSVTSAGGTSLFQAVGATSRSGEETTWILAGSGCSQTQVKPSWQTDKGCLNRTVADVSAVADTQTPVWVYLQGNWYQAGGTSVASPIVASAIALGDKHYTYSPALPYASPASFNDVTSGNNGTCPSSVAYLCNGAVGYDGPTGLGSPNGIAGFSATAPVDAPVISISTPSFGAEVLSGSITVSGAASDAANTISSVAISLDGGAYKNVTGTNSWTTTVNASVLSSGLHNITLKATNSKGGSSIASTGILTGHIIPPNPPDQLNANVVSSSEVDLSWSAVTDSNGTIAGYNVYREGHDDNQNLYVYQQVASKVSTTSFKDTGLPPSTNYYYFVAAVDTNGLVSPLSTQVGVLTQSKSGDPPTAPVISLTSNSSNSVTISWTASQSTIGIAGYNVSRTSSPSQSGFNFPPSTLSYTDNTVLPGTSYSYYLESWDLNGTNSPHSLPLTLTTPTTITPPPPVSIPTGLTSSAPTYNQVNLSWNSSTGGTGGVDYYKVFVNGVAIANVPTVSESAPQVYFIDALNLKPLTTYNFAVEAYDYADNHSALSTSSRVTTPAKYNVSALVGTVTDSITHKPISGVTVKDFASNKLTYTASTNSKGIYKFYSLPAGTNKFRFIKSGYATKYSTQTLGIIISKTLNISLVKG